MRSLVLAVTIGSAACLIGDRLELRAEDRASAQPSPFTVVPGERFGPIRETTTRRELGQLLGTTALEDMPIPIGEGFCTDGTRAFGGTPDQIDVAWKTPEGQGVGFVRSSSAGARWATPRGVRVGNLLTELERLAGRVLEFSGFGWDYGGGLAWTEGHGSLGLRLDVDLTGTSLEAFEREVILGDRVVRSDNPVIRRLRVRVDEIIQSWGGHGREFDCP